MAMYSSTRAPGMNDPTPRGSEEGGRSRGSGLTRDVQDLQASAREELQQLAALLISDLSLPLFQALLE